MEHFYQEIPGWFAAESIYRAAVNHFGPGSRFVEIGSWKGKSAAFMAVEIGNSGKDIKFFIVDNWKGSDEEAHLGDPDVINGTLEAACMRNLERSPIPINSISADSRRAVTWFEDGSLDFIFIDASHDEESVTADIEAWMPKLKPSGVIAGDDLQISGVYFAVAKAFGTRFWPVGRCWVVCQDAASLKAFTGFSGLMIATPAYNGVTSAYLLSMLRTQQGLAARQFRSEIVLQSGASLITRARNTLAAAFIASDHSHFLFIDSDIEWEPSSVLRLLRSDKDVICGAYPKKKFPVTYTVNFKEGSENGVRMCPISGAVEIRDAPTGFLMIRRNAFERLMSAHPELHYDGPNGLTADQDKFVYAFFECLIVDGHYLSEDYGFCHRWKQLGGEIWLDPNIRLNHHGNYTYEGDVSRLFADVPEQMAAE